MAYDVQGQPQRDVGDANSVLSDTPAAYVQMAVRTPPAAGDDVMDKPSTKLPGTVAAVGERGGGGSGKHYDTDTRFREHG